MPSKSTSDRKSGARPTALRTIAALRATISRARSKGKAVALVPTMGALHAGHLELVRLARQRSGFVVASIFVNPSQFAPNEDFGSYPRTWHADLAALARLKVDAVWAPTVATMYPEGFQTRITPGGPAVVGLEDKFRPHFFGGVCTVVAKLLLQVQPDIAIFGEKDYQQLKVIAAMARDLNIPVKIVGLPTVRESDGLALSSRNAYLSVSERAKAPALYHALKGCAARLRQGVSVRKALTEGRAAIEAAGFAVDYLEARHAKTLEPLASPADGPIRLLVAARLGRTRMIDNVAV